MQRPTSPHTRFFTSLKHLEKRLKLENHPSATSPPPPPPPPPPPTASQEIINNNNTQQTDSLGTPLYLNCNHSNTAYTSSVSNVPESEAPQEFLSKSPDYPSTHHNSPHENQPELHEIVDRAEERSDLDDDIEMLMQLLDLGDERERVNSNVGCDDGFYRKIVGAKGPKSVKEVERLEKWIEHLLNGGGKMKREPFLLAHLLLGKAAFVRSGDGFGGFNFPSSIDEFLQND